MTRFLSSCFLMAFIACAGFTRAGDEGPSKKIPELKVLDHYLGTWETEITSKGLPFTKGIATAKWILDGRFIQQTGELKDKDGATVIKVTTLLTYDSAKKTYRSWTFVSDGATSESEGTWDAKKRVMTSVGRKDENGGFSTTIADFSQAGVERWSIVFKDGTGNVVSEMSGRNSRRKKQ